MDITAPVTELVQNGGAVIETFVEGAGPALIMLPSYGRDAGADFDHFAKIVAKAGFQVLRPRPRGIGRSSGSMSASLQDMADDVVSVIYRLAEGSAVVLGHAYGNVIARLLANSRSDVVRGIILVTASADNPPKDIEELPFIAGNLALPEEERLQALRRGFFAPYHDARQWLSGWYPDTLQMQKAAINKANPSTFSAAGTAPILEIIAESDPFNPFSSWRERRERFGERVTTRIIADADHALFPEQTPFVGELVIQWMCSLQGQNKTRISSANQMLISANQQ